MRTRDERRYAREVKAWRRIKEDRAQHGGNQPVFSACPCFGDPDPHVWGRTFARFADTPKACSCSGCGNRRRYEGVTHDERRATDDHLQQLRELHVEDA
jgi:hypothetical protein